MIGDMYPAGAGGWIEVVCGVMFSGMNRLEKPMMWYSRSVAAVTNAIAALASRGVRHEPATEPPPIEPLTSRASSIGLPQGSTFWKVA